MIDALDMAIYRRKPLAVVHHSDQGSKYTSIAFGLRCKSAGIRPSMGSRGDCYDNAMCESFNATLECALLFKHRFKTQRDSEAAVFDYIEASLLHQSNVDFICYDNPYCNVCFIVH